MVYHAIESLDLLRMEYRARNDIESVNEINLAIKVLENLEDSLDAKKQRNRASLFDF